MSKSRAAPAFDDGRTTHQSDDSLIDGWEVNHYDPDALVLRCTECGFLDALENREEANSQANQHAIECGNQVGLTPIAQSDDHDTNHVGDWAIVTYESRQSGNELQRSGTVISQELVDGEAELRIDDDPIVVARWRPGDDHGLECLSVGSQTTHLGTVLDVEFRPAKPPSQKKSSNQHGFDCDECPLCGADIGNLAAHLPDCPEEVDQ